MMTFKIRLSNLQYVIIFLLILGINREAQANTFLEKALLLYASCSADGSTKKISDATGIHHGESGESWAEEGVITEEDSVKVNEFAKKIPNMIAFHTEERRKHGLRNSEENEDIYDPLAETYNEDRFMDYCEDGMRIIVVSDGHDGAEISGQLTKSKDGIALFLGKLSQQGHDIGNPEVLSTAFLSYNETLKQEGFKKSGSTCTLLIDKQGDKNLTIASVGDSPCMAFTPQGKILTTKDHNVGNAVEVGRLGSVTDTEYKVIAPNRYYKYFSVRKQAVKYKDDDDYEEEELNAINRSRTFGDEFRLLPIPDVAKIPRENVSLVALFSDGLTRAQIIKMVKESSPDNLKEGYNIVFPTLAARFAGLRLQDDATVVFYNPNKNQVQKDKS